MTKIGEACQYLRNLTGLTQRAAAKKIGISYVALCRIERDHVFPQTATLDALKEFYGVDIYIFAWCLSGDLRKLPPAVRGAAYDLTAAWKANIEKILKSKKL